MNVGGVGCNSFPKEPEFQPCLGLCGKKNPKSLFFSNKIPIFAAETEKNIVRGGFEPRNTYYPIIMKATLFTVWLLLASLTSSAQWGPRPVRKAPARNYELKTSDGRSVMTIDAANGARITSLRYDTAEVLSQNPMPNMYGSTFWTSPQKDWNWPPIHEHDMGGYAVEEERGRYVMTSPLSQKMPVRITKIFQLSSDKHGFQITYRLKNEGSEARSVAPWEVTRVPGNGTVAFLCKAGDIWPAGLMDFRQKGEEAVYAIDKVKSQRKVNANGTGYLRYTNAEGVMLTKCFPDLKAGEAAPGEDEIQVYVHQDALYCELEEQGPYTLLQPGESMEWSVVWYVEQTGK